MGVQDDAERVEPATLDEWSAWLASHHERREGIWLVTFKGVTGRQQFPYEAGVIEALRWGWVDSTVRTVDDERTMMWMAPRRRGSVWTRPNKERIERLEDEGRLEPAGRAAVEAAKASGMWTLLDSAADLVVPDDLAAALDQLPGAREQFDGFPPSARKAILEWLLLAKRPETRAKRVAEAAEKAANGERAR
ncbi:YdeI/OmpD-associated family protein [Nocardioides coralli]|uniref:YdeI/OmpD-associated family protein n=1 Tax=Nocardioides coralli TaxID=2872154 RepID=UPI001CA446D0|nr:YdeI/OmpD-associated family protein [Nocardioides coralli]QZY28221.1 YdeI/OmpD-associated family protein [Nocardioides coralli]